jgi:hypothetical protein
MFFLVTTDFPNREGYSPVIGKGIGDVKKVSILVLANIVRGHSQKKVFHEGNDFIVLLNTRKKLIK